VRLIEKIGVVLAVIGLLLWLPSYFSKISISVENKSFDPHWAVPSLFEVTKNGILDVYSIDYACFYERVVTDPPIDFRYNAYGPVSLARTLAPSQTLDFRCMAIRSAPAPAIVGSTLTVVASFRPAYTQHRAAACARFTVERNAIRQPEWKRVPPVIACSIMYKNIADRTFLNLGKLIDDKTR
jgi:hypothetical protein